MVKLRILFFCFMLVFLAIIVKLFYLQVLGNYQLNDNYYLKTNQIQAERGRIYDRKAQALVLNQSNYLLFIEPKKITEKLRFRENISSILEISPASLEARIDTNKEWVAVKGNIDKQIKEKIDALNLNGLGFDEGYRRYYPESSLSAHLLGFVGKNAEGEDLGYFGIEGYYNQDLAGIPGLFKTERDILGRPILVGTQEKIESENGRDLTLTIDKSVQVIAKSKLLAGLDQYQAKEGCIIIADPNTGEILSLVCLPDFDLDKYYSFSESYFKNPAISNLYEPGSIFKPLIMAAALEEKAIKPDDTYDEKGPIQIGEYTIRTWNSKYEGKISITKILEKSSNVGMVYIGQKLGQDKIYQYLKAYEFGQKSGIDLQEEIPGFLRPKGSWYPIDYATVTFGQGIAITPIQMIKAFSSLINGGLLYKPYLVKKASDQTSEKEIKPKLIKRVLSKKTSDLIKKMLVASVEHAEAKWRRPTGYTIGGKTGTAQIPIEGHYDPTKTIASFIGFAPYNKPKFLALVILKEPQSSPWGSETAAPLFFDLAKELFVYYNISPE